MKKTIATGQTCVGDLRLSSLDLGFDPRRCGMSIRLPESFSSVGIDEGGETLLVEGTREEMIEAIKAAWYRIAEEKIDEERPH